jgi:hypothetical protein
MRMCIHSYRLEVIILGSWCRFWFNSSRPTAAQPKHGSIRVFHLPANGEELDYSRILSTIGAKNPVSGLRVERENRVYAGLLLRGDDRS